YLCLIILFRSMITILMVDMHINVSFWNTTTLFGDIANQMIVTFIKPKYIEHNRMKSLDFCNIE
ncbi:hypothetical protein ACJX0J_020418, partial [Zea mays]